MVVFQRRGAKTFRLDEGDRLRIAPKGTWHIHANPFDKPSLTYWEAEGDIRKVIETIRKSAQKNVKVESLMRTVDKELWGV